MNWKTLMVNLLIALPVVADDFKTANALYDAGRFAEAAALYEKITPSSAGVLFNLGNACFRQNKLGLAILHYERARRIAPRDPDILANLKFAQQRLGVDEVNQPSQPFRRFWTNVTASRTQVEWSWMEITAWWIVWLAVAGGIWLPKWRTGFLLAAAMAACVWAVATAALISRITSPPEAIVLVSKAEARSAPVPLATALFPLTEGTRVAIREDRGEWWFIERADGKQGWMARSSLERI